MTNTNEDLDRLLDELFDELDNEEEELERSRAELADELVAQGSSPEDAKHWVKTFKSYTANELDNLKEEGSELLALLDGPFKVLRDDTFPDPDRLLVWDRQATPSVQSLTFDEVTERYQCGGEGSRWVPEDLQAVKDAKAECLEETLSSYAKQEKDPDFEGLCSTPALVVSNNPLTAHRWSVVKACLSPEARGARQ